MLQTNNFVKGLVTDTHPKNQDSGTYRFALNAVLETKEGNITSISNERGNTLCASNLPDKTIIGDVQVSPTEVVLFLYDSAGRPEHEIGTLNTATCQYTTIAKGDCLNFSDKYPINALYKIRNGCETIVYFTDNYNPYRVINITDTTETVFQDTKFLKSCDRIAYSRPSYSATTLSTTLRDFGGNVDVGTYHFAVRHLDENENATDFKYFSPAFPVGNGASSVTTALNTTMQYDGGSADSTEVGYVPTTTKSIELLLYGLDTSFKYYQIAVVRRNSTDGTITSVDLLYPTPIPQSALTITTDTFIYTGQDSQIKTQISIDDVLVPNQWVHQVAAQAQLDSTLYIGNVSNKQRDYSILQAHASSIKVEHVKTAVNGASNNVKSGTYYFKEGSFMPDEIYALGIVYVYKDGTESPVFHIPGRAPNTVTGTNPYITSFTNWDTDTIVSDINVFNTNKTKRWQVYNTATKYGVPPSGSDVGGLMGYYETPTYYPEIERCDGEPYWGTDWQGNTIDSNTHIRHHRMPSTELYKNLSDTHYRVGIKFTVTDSYPDPDIRDHYYVYSDRTYERTVLDRGLIVPLVLEGTNGMFYQFPVLPLKNYNFSDPNPFENIDPANQTYGFVSNQQNFLEQHYSPSYVRLEKHFNFPYTHDYATVDNDVYQQVINAATGMVKLDGYSLPTTFNYAVQFSSYLPSAASGSPLPSVFVPAAARSLENRSISNGVTALTFTRNISEVSGNAEYFDDNSFYAVLKADTDVFTNLSTIRYRRIHSDRLVASTIPHSVSLYAGDTFVTYTQMSDVKWTQSADLFLASMFVSYITDDDYINSEFRHGDSKEPKYGYYHNDFTSNHETYRDYLATKYYEPVEDQAAFYPEKYLYNKSYSHINDLVTLYPLSYNYDYCDACRETFPFRVFASQTDTGESIYDPYRIIKINDYKDSNNADGAITDLFTNFDKLFFTTPQGAFFIPTKPQTLNTNQDLVYIGTGATFSQAFQRLSSNSFAFGGQELFKSRTETEYGVFYIDSVTSRPILLSDKLNDLSLRGVRSFWQENGHLLLEKQFQSKGSTYPVKSTSSASGIGYSTIYDARHKRIVVSKKDFAIKDLYFNSFSPTYSANNSTLFFDEDKFYYRDAGGTTTQVLPTDITYFDNKSFTMSYSFLTNGWVSYHSYLPNYMFNTHENYFSVADLPYKHNTGNYQKYYDIKYDHILDLIVRMHTIEGKQPSNIYYSSTTEDYSNVYDAYQSSDVTFDRFVAYNNTQSTGIVPLTLKGVFDSDTLISSALVSKVDNYYRISNIRDRVISPNEPLWAEAYDYIAPYFYIDKVPNPVNIGSPSFFEDARFRDTYMGLRLYFNPPTDTKITTDLASVKFQSKNR